MKRLITLLAVAGALVIGASPALAHPLGNFTTNVHLGIEVEGSLLDVLLIVDMAEIPTFREQVEVGELDTYAESMCGLHASSLELASADDFVALTRTSSIAALQPGQNDLDTLRLECRYRGELPMGAESLDVRNGVYDERSGWAEIVVTGGTAPGITERSPSKLLTEYPGTSPLDQRDTTISFVGPTADRAVESGDDETAATGGPITERIASLLERAGSTGGLIAVAAALTLGVTHALAPGHGKTLMAAYLVGRNGTPRQAAGLGLAVAVSHTLGVGALGLITALASSRFQPETVYPWLTTGSALIVTGLGAAMLIRAFRSRSPQTQDHDHHHGQDHGHTHEPPRDLGWRSLATLGLAGGLVPSASAVVLLLGAVAIGRVWFGVGLVFAFGVGMSLALVAAGLVALRVAQFGVSRMQRRWTLPRRLVPTLAGFAVTLFGVALLWDATRSLL